MTINEIQINGIDESNMYYFLNPIFLEIKSEKKFVTNATLRFTNKSAKSVTGTDLSTTDFKLQSNPEGVIYVDIAEYIKNIAVYANGYRAKVVNKDLPYSLNDIDFEIEVATREDEEPTLFEFNKLFIRGYEITTKTNNKVESLNIGLYDPETLEDTNVPYYIVRNIEDLDYPFTRLRYRINENNRVELYYISKSEVNLKNYVFTHGCNSLIFRFLNSKGGYNHIFFNTYNVQSSSETETERIKINQYSQNKVLFLSKNVKNDKEYIATQDFDARFRYFVDEFIRSSFVQVSFDGSVNFVDVEIQSNSVPATNESSFEVAYKFKLNNSINI